VRLMESASTYSKRTNISRAIHFFVGSLKDLLTNEKRETTQSASHKLGEGGVLEEAHLGVLRPAVHVVA
jgi:hypothetical protein